MAKPHNEQVVRVAGTPTTALLRADDYLSELQRELELVRLSSAVGDGHDDPVHVLSSISAILTACAAVRMEVRGAAERAAAAGATTFDAMFCVPAAAYASAVKLRDLLGEATAIAEQGGLLTLPPSSEVTNFIADWLGAVASQLAHGEAAKLAAFREPRRAHRFTRWAITEPPPIDAEGRPRGRQAVRARFEPTLTASRRARELLRRVEDRWGREELCEVAELPLSELVTNAVLHARTTIEIAVCFVDESLRVEVHDEQPELNAQRSRDLDATTGRGLELVGAIADRWGVTRQRSGKTVWFEVDPASR